MYITRKLWGIVKKNLLEILKITGWTILSIILDIGRMLSYAFLITYLLEDKGADRIAFALGAVVLSTIVQRCSEHIIVHNRAVYGDAIKTRLRAELFEKLFYLGPQFIDRKRSGEIITTLWEKIEWFHYYLLYYIPTTVAIAGCGALCAGIWLKQYSVLSWIILIVTGLILATPILFHKTLGEKGQGEWEENDEFYSTCLEGLKGIVTLKSFNANELHRKKVNEKAEEVRKSTMANLVLTTANSKALEFLVLAGEFTTDIVGVCGVISGKLSPDKLIPLIFMMWAWAEGARQILGAWLRGNKGIAGFESILEILEAECTYSLVKIEESKSDNREISAIKGNIEFENVTFCYAEKENPAIQNVSFTIANGTQTALVGSSGSGKSTIAYLLFGFYSPQKGCIRVDGKEIGEENVADIQNLMTVIWQDCYIFHMSCYENIRIARMDATEEEIYEAARKANIHDMIQRLPEGYHTVIGDGGRNFSGGEKQRIAIARAFLRDAPILILDEATSALDRKNEMDIQRCICELSEGKTVLVIAHRLDTIQKAEQICVMEGGQIMERGSHEELMKRGKRYCELMGNTKGGREYAS